ncbi:4 TM domain-containing transmembrane protein [Acrasis kona]|uniref:4 TM domain-containing transmembrane protein n=1 Tax=Acrasis kona TaxID=1008807 RepID=A0AAW2Z908_9EUKA
MSTDEINLDEKRQKQTVQTTSPNDDVFDETTEGNNTQTIVDFGQEQTYTQPIHNIDTSPQVNVIVYEKPASSYRVGLVIGFFALLLLAASLTYTILCILALSGYTKNAAVGSYTARAVSGVVGAVAGFVGILSMLRYVRRRQQYRLTWVYMAVLILDIVLQTGINLYSTVMISMGRSDIGSNGTDALISSIFLLILAILVILCCVACAGIRIKYMKREQLLRARAMMSSNQEVNIVTFQ